MLRVILPSLQRKSSNRIILQQLHFFILLSFYLVLLHQILAEWIAIKRPNSSHVIPISLEITILLLVGFFGVQRFINIIKEMDCLFNALSMGVQNSMVTQISNSIVRTTH
jgi:uncharacterized membrane protein YoaK (UPF0700 family)